MERFQEQKAYCTRGYQETEYTPFSPIQYKTNELFLESATTNIPNNNFVAIPTYRCDVRGCKFVRIPGCANNLAMFGPDYLILLVSNSFVCVLVKPG